MHALRFFAARAQSPTAAVRAPLVCRFRGPNRRTGARIFKCARFRCGRNARVTRHCRASCFVQGPVAPGVTVWVGVPTVAPRQVRFEPTPGVPERCGICRDRGETAIVRPVEARVDISTPSKQLFRGRTARRMANPAALFPHQERGYTFSGKETWAWLKISGST